MRISSGAMALQGVAEVALGLVAVAVAAADQEWIGGTDRINLSGNTTVLFSNFDGVTISYLPTSRL